MRRAVERVLQAAGYLTSAFASSEALLAERTAHHAACLVLDINLPGLSGLELYARIAEPPGRRVPVVFITAHDSAASREAATRAGALAYLLKPFSGRELLAAVAAGRAMTRMEC